MKKKKTKEELEKWHKEHTKKWNKILGERGALHWPNEKDK